MRYVLDAEGRPVREPDPLKAARWFKTADRKVARTDFPSGAFVSTVFLALDHAFPGGPPVLWETMSFGVPDEHQAQRRYCSREEALAGHREVVEETARLLGEMPAGAAASTFA